MNARRIPISLVFSITLFAGVSALSALERFKQQPGQFSAVDLDGKKVTLADLKNKIAFVTYWQVSCYPCRQELPRLDQFQKEWADKPVVFLTLNPWNDRGDIQKFRDGANPGQAALKNLRFLTRDASSAVWGLPASKSGYIGTPTTVVLDRSGTVVGRSIGGMDLDEARAFIKDLLSEQAPPQGAKPEESMTITGRIRIRSMKQLDEYRPPAPGTAILPRTTGPAWKE